MSKFNCATFNFMRLIILFPLILQFCLYQKPNGWLTYLIYY